MKIGKKSIERLSKELAGGWRGYLAANQRQVLAGEIAELIQAVIEREQLSHEGIIGMAVKVMQ